MNHTGVQSTGSRRQARRNRSVLIIIRPRHPYVWTLLTRGFAICQRHDGLTGMPIDYASTALYRRSLMITSRNITSHYDIVVALSKRSCEAPSSLGLESSEGACRPTLLAAYLVRPASTRFGETSPMAPL